MKAIRYGEKQFSPLFNISGAIKNIAVHMGGAGSLIIGMLHISNLQPAFSSDENLKQDVKHEHWLEISMKSTKKKPIPNQGNLCNISDFTRTFAQRNRSLS